MHMLRKIYIYYHILSIKKHTIYVDYKPRILSGTTWDAHPSGRPRETWKYSRRNSIVQGIT